MAPHKSTRSKSHKNYYKSRNSKKKEKKMKRRRGVKQVAQVNKNEKKKQANNLLFSLERENNLVAVREKDQIQKHLDDYRVVNSSEQAPSLAIVKEEAPFGEQDMPFISDSQIQAQVKIEKIDSIKKIEKLGGGVKRKRPMKIDCPERYIKREPANDVEKCLISCLEDVKLLVSNLPSNCTQSDLVRFFNDYSSLQCAYVLDCDASGKSLSKAVLIFNDRAHAKQVIKDYNGVVLYDCDVALKVELISSMRRYEYGSPLNLIHYQVVKSPSMFKHTPFNYSTIDREMIDD